MSSSTRTMSLLKAHGFVSAMEAEILREAPEIDSVLTHIESEPATIEHPDETMVEDRRIEMAPARRGANFAEIKRRPRAHGSSRR